ncbi:MAG: hypothetical protein SV487_05345 [Thermodesulfobacteriota bacterium]|nr:hypothetical protein [Thermodesulfobacteriota bacterium]
MSKQTLKCDNVGYDENGRTIFRNVSFSLEMGQGGFLLAELHRNSRLLLLLCSTLLRPTRGQFYWFGDPGQPKNKNFNLTLRQSIGLVHRETRLVSNMSIIDNITLGMLYHRNISYREARFEIKDLMERLDLYKYRNIRPAELSFEKQRLAVYARELAKKPKLFLLEAPTLDLGQRAYQMMMRDIRDRTDRQECAFLISAMSPEEGQKWVEWILVLGKDTSRMYPAGEFDPARHFLMQTRLDDTSRHIEMST